MFLCRYRDDNRQNLGGCSVDGNLLSLTNLDLLAHV